MYNSHNYFLILWLLAPIILSGIIHMFCVSKKYFTFFAVPINAPIFGSNKTWRGFVLMPILTTLNLFLLFPFKPNLLSFTLEQILYIGPLVGLAYVLFELPNSYLKRKMGIAPGKTANKHKWFFIWLDHTDSAIGCLSIYYLFLDVSFRQILGCYLFGIVLHFFVNFLLYIFKIRKNAL